MDVSEIFQKCDIQNKKMFLVQTSLRHQTTASVIQIASAIIFKPRHLNETIVMPQDQKQEHQEGADCGERDPQCGKLESYLMLLFGLVFGCYLCSADT